MLREALNVNCRSHTPNRELYGSLPNTSRTLRERRLKFSGHYYRSKEEIIRKVILSEPSYGRRGRGRPAKTYLDRLEGDSGPTHSKGRSDKLERCGQNCSTEVAPVGR